MSLPRGKGWWIWAIRDCKAATGFETGDPKGIALRLKQSGITHAIVKIANGMNVPGVNYQTAEQTKTLCSELKIQGISTWGWQYVKGASPQAEATLAANLVKEWNLDGFAADLEGEFDTLIPSANLSKADAYCKTLRSLLPDTLLALASYRYPSSHPNFPWQIRKYFNVDMPQVYWEGSDNPGYQTTKSFGEFYSMTPRLPFIPIGAAYKRSTWEVTPYQILEFLNTCQELNLRAANFWELGRTDLYLPHLYTEVENFNWVIEEELPMFDMVSFTKQIGLVAGDNIIKLDPVPAGEEWEVQVVSVYVNIKPTGEIRPYFMIYPEGAFPLHPTSKRLWSSWTPGVILQSGSYIRVDIIGATADTSCHIRYYYKRIK